MVGVVGSSPIAPTNILPNITLPDGSVKSYPGPVTVAEIAQSIGAGLARAALAGKVDGRLVDAATSATVTGPGKDLTEPSGSLMLIMRQKRKPRVQRHFASAATRGVTGGAWGARPNDW